MSPSRDSILYVSDSFENVWGRSKAELFKNPNLILESAIQADKKRIMDATAHFISSGEMKTDYRIEKLDGEIRSITLELNKIYDQNNILVGYLGKATDVTDELKRNEELKQLRNELQYNQQLLANIINTQKELICRYLPDTTFTFVNPAYAKMFDSSVESLIGKKYLMFLPEDIHQDELLLLKNLNTNNPYYTKTYSIIDPSGKTQWIEWTDQAIFDGHGNVLEIQGTGHVVTELINTIEKLEEKNELLTLSQDVLAFGTYTVDLVSENCYASQGLNKLLGIENNDVHPLDVWADIIHPDDKRKSLLAHEDSLKNHRDYVLVYRIIKPNDYNTLWIYDIGKIVYEDNIPNSITGVMVDISKVKDLESGLRESHKSLKKSYEDTIRGLALTLSLKDDETQEHSQRVTDLSLQLARVIGFPEDQIEFFKYGALLHDIGKIGIPDSILLKPGKLTDAEFDEIKKHPVYAYNIISKIEYLKPSLDIPYYHHEKWDGSGYPKGLKGLKIPLAARIFAIIDVYDALTSDRPYRKAWTIEKTLDYIEEQKNKHFDPRLVDIFIKMISGKL